MTNPAVWLLVVLVVIGGWIVVIYNRMVALKARSRNAWSDIDVQLKRRHDLVPNLVNTVQGYASHEKTLFETIARARAQAMGATTPKDSSQAEAGLESSLKTLFALSEAYPDLKASDNFVELQRQLADVENNIQYARRYYNAVVRDFNTLIQSIPANLVAGTLGFREMFFFQADADERDPVAFSLTK